jgi:hypothetical protein
MPDLDSELAGLGSGLREAVRQPDVTEVIERARRRTNRRVQLATIVAVVVAVAAVPLLRLGVQRGTVMPARDTRPGTISKIDFFDAKHGFAIATHCDSQFDGCIRRLLVTEDGQTWRWRDLPSDLGESTEVDRLYALGPRSVAIEGYAPARQQLKTWFTGNAGETWQSPPKFASEQAGEIPHGAALVIGCQIPRTDSTCKTSVNVVLPGSGTLAGLKSQPDFPVRDVQSAPDADGTWWAFGADDSALRVASSRDRGRTWQSSALPHSYRIGVQVAVVTAPGYVHAAVIDPIGEGGPHLLRLYRSTDGGRSWESRWQSGSGDPVTINGMPIAGANGEVYITDSKLITYVSFAHGNFFKRVGSPEDEWMAGAIRWTKAGYLSGVLSSNVYWLSRDGTHWTRAEVVPSQ